MHWLAVSPDGRTLATAAGGKNPDTGQMSIDLWDVATRKRRPIDFAESDETFSAAFSPDGNLLATSHARGHIQIWNVRTGKRLHQLHGHTKACFRLCFSKDGSFFASAGADGKIIVWDTATLKQRVVCDGPYMAYSVAISADDSMLAVARSDSSVEVWEAVTGERRAVLLGHTDGVRTVAFRHDGLRFASGARKRAPTVKVWDTAKALGDVQVMPLKTGGLQSTTLTNS